MKRLPLVLSVFGLTLASCGGEPASSSFYSSSTSDSASQSSTSSKSSESSSSSQTGEQSSEITPDTSESSESSSQDLPAEWIFAGFIWTKENNGAYTVQARYVDKNHPTEDKVYQASVTVETAKEATCEDNGLIVYTASYDGHLETKDVIVEALGHKFAFAAFVWQEEEDHTFTAKAKYVCDRDDAHVEYHKAVVTSRIALEPTCEEDGKIVFTASYDGHTEDKEIAIAPIGHQYEFEDIIFSEDEEGKVTAVAHYVCANDDEHSVDYEAEVEGKVAVEPTFDFEGTYTYTATFAGHTKTMDVSIPKLDVFKYALNDEGTAYTLTGLSSKTMDALVLPREHNGLPVTAIAKRAITDCNNLRYIYFPSTYVTAGNEALFGCKPSQILFEAESLPSGFKGYNSFTNCGVIYNVSQEEVDGIVRIDDVDYMCHDEKVMAIAARDNVPAVFHLPHEISILGSMREVTAVANYAFFYHGPSVLYLKDNLSVGSYAFDKVNFTYVPSTVEMSSSSSLETTIYATDSESTIRYLSSSAHYLNLNLDDIVTQDGVIYAKIGEDATAISYTGGGNGLIQLPEEVEFEDETLPLSRIGSYCFAPSKTKAASYFFIPACITMIEANAFQNSGCVVFFLDVSSVPTGFASGWNNGVTRSYAMTDNAFVLEGSLLYSRDLSGYEVYGSLYDLPENLEIPSSIEVEGEEKPIVGINAGAFKNNKYVQKVTLPSSVRSISKEAFYDCGITELVASEGLVSIGESAFYGCDSLKRISLPSTLTTLNKSSFENCTSLRTLSLGSVKSIPERAFYNCNSLLAVSLPSTCRSIGQYGFYENRAAVAVFIPSSVTSIAASAFSGYASSYRRFYAEASSRPNGWNSSSGIANSSIIYNYRLTALVEQNNIYCAISGNSAMAIGMIDTSSKFIKLPNAIAYGNEEKPLTSVASGAFAGYTNRAFYIPDSITDAPSGAFNTSERNAYLFESTKEADGRSVVIGNLSSYVEGVSSDDFDKMVIIGGVYYVVSGDRAIAFFGLLESYSQTDITIRSSVTIDEVTYPVKSIANKAFYKVSMLSLTIGEGVEEIGEYAFSGCSSLKSVSLPSTLTSISAAAFLNCSNLSTITIPLSVTEVGNSAFYGINSNCLFLVEASREECDFVSNLPTFAIYGANENTTIWQDGIFYVINQEGGATAALADNSSINGDVVIPSSITIKGEEYSVNLLAANLFKNNTAIESISLPEGILSLPNSLCYGCTSLREINFPNSVQSIGENAFRGCVALEEAILGDSVLTIGADCFNGDNSLTKAVLSPTITSIGEGAFTSCTNLVSIVMPDALKTLGNRCFENCPSLLQVTLASGVESIPTRAFYGCSNLQTVTILGTIKYFNESCFSSCASLLEINVPANSYVNNYAFSSCNSLTIYCGDVAQTSHFSSWWNYSNCPVFWGVLHEGEATVGGITYLYGGTGAILMDSDLSQKEVTIASSVEIEGNTYEVRAVKTNAFSGCEIEKLVLPSTILYAEEGYLAGVIGLKNLTIPFVGAKVLNSFDDRKQYPLGYAFGESEEGAWQTFIDYVSATYSDGSKDYSYLSIRYAIPSSLKSVTVLKGMIPYAAFSSVSISEITFGEGVTAIASDAITSSRVKLLFLEGNAILGSYFIDNGKAASLLVSGDSVNPSSASDWANCVENVFYNATKEGLVMVDGITYICRNELAVPLLCDFDALPTNFVLHGTITVDGVAYSVNKVASYFFSGAGFKTVVIEEGIISIGRYAFSKCSNLTSVTLPNSLLTLEEGTFESCTSLVSVTLPNSLLTLGKGAFESCTSLVSITLPNSLSEVGEHAFSQCSSLTTINFGEGVEKLGNYAFSSTAIATLDLPSSLIEIGVRCFSSCPNLVTVTIPNSVRKINHYAFSSCKSLVSLSIGSGVTYLGDGIVSGCSSLASLDLPFIGRSGPVAINDETYFGLAKYFGDDKPSDIDNFYVVKGWVSSRNYDFYYVPKTLAHVGIDRGHLCSYALTEFSSLTSLTLGENVTSLGNNVFLGCDNLPRRHIHAVTDSLKDIYYITFISTTDNPFAILLTGEISRNDAFTIPASCRFICENAFLDQQILQSMNFEEGSQLVFIGESAFSGCTSLTNFNGEFSKLTMIPKNCFYGCNNLTTFTFSEPLMEIGEMAFYQTGLTNFVAPSTLAYIDESAFANCFRLLTVDFTGTENLIIQDKAFNYSYSIVYVNLGGGGIYYIGQQAFDQDNKAIFVLAGKRPSVLGSSWKVSSCPLYELSSVDDIAKSNGLIYIRDGGYAKLIAHTKVYKTDLTIPSVVAFGEDLVAVKSIAPYAMRGAVVEAGVILSEGITALDDYAFYECVGLTSISLPDSLTSVGINVFAGCNSLGKTVVNGIWYLGNESNKYLYLWGGSNAAGDITLPSGVRFIAEYAFYQNDKLTSIILPSGLLTIHECAFAYTNIGRLWIPKSVTYVGSSVCGGRSNRVVTIALEATSVPSSWAVDWDSIDGSKRATVVTGQPD